MGQLIEIDTTVLAVVISALLSYFLFMRKDRALKFLMTIPGPPPLPIVGNAFLFNDPPQVFRVVENWIQEYGGRVRILLGSYKYLGLFNPQDVEKVLTSSAVTAKSNVYQFLDPWLGTGLLTSSGKKWHTHRKFLTPAFHFTILESFYHVFNEQSEILVDILKTKVAQKEIVGMHSMFSRCALDIICETAMGKKLNCQRDLTHPYALATVKESGYIYQRLTSPWLHPNFLFRLSKHGRAEAANRKTLLDFVDQVIEDRKAEIILEKQRTTLEDKAAESNNSVEDDACPKKKFAFLDLLINLQMEGEIGLTDEEIREETNTFMFEGHDTTSAGLTWTLFLLGSNPDIQEKVHAELDDVFGDNRDRPVAASDLPNLKYLECCIKEALRLYPSVPLLARKVEQDFALDEKTIVPAGINFLVIPWLLHRHPEYFPDPERYDPSRHFPENANSRHPYAYIPFSAGPRNCIGQRFALGEEKVVLANVLRHFRARTINPETVIPLPELVVRPKEEIMFELELRR